MALFPIHLIPADTALDFMKKRWLAFILSAVLIIGSLGLVATKSLNFGIDFTGGIVMEVRFDDTPSLAELRTRIGDLVEGEISLQHFGSDRDIMIRLQANQAANGGGQAVITAVKQTLSKRYPDIEYRKVDFVGPQVGSELIQSGILALLLSFAGILIYIWIRFEWYFGLGAILAVIHDTILTIGLYSALGLEFNLTSIAAILTIIGYSINDSVVIYDRIREYLRKYKKKPLTDILNISINSTLSRTLLTAGTTLTALLALVIFGGEALYGLSLAVLFGVTIGTYSSIFIAAPILIYLHKRPAKTPTAGNKTQEA